MLLPSHPFSRSSFLKLILINVMLHEEMYFFCFSSWITKSNQAAMLIHSLDITKPFFVGSCLYFYQPTGSSSPGCCSTSCTTRPERGWLGQIKIPSATLSVPDGGQRQRCNEDGKRGQTHSSASLHSVPYREAKSSFFCQSWTPGTPQLLPGDHKGSLGASFCLLPKPLGSHECPQGYCCSTYSCFITKANYFAKSFLACPGVFYIHLPELLFSSLPPAQIRLEHFVGNLQVARILFIGQVLTFTEEFGQVMRLVQYLRIVPLGSPGAASSSVLCVGALHQCIPPLCCLLLQITPG